MNKFTYLAIMFFILGTVSAAGLGGVKAALNNICVDMKDLLPLVSIFVLVLGGVVYGIGQVMGAEMRSRTTSWAQAMFIGAVIGLLIGLSAPAIVNFILHSVSGDEIGDYELCQEHLSPDSF